MQPAAWQFKLTMFTNHFGVETPSRQYYAALLCRCKPANVCSVGSVRQWKNHAALDFGRHIATGFRSSIAKWFGLDELDEQQRVAMRREHIGFVFQRFHLIRGLNALENVIVPLTIENIERRQARQRGLELLEAVGLADHTSAMPSKMSTGQCQRVARPARVGDRSGTRIGGRTDLRRSTKPMGKP